MKKYLMTGVAAVAMCAAFTSCSKNENLYDPGAVEEMEIASVYEQYNQAFIKTFGQVNPNQDWGFGSNFGKVGTRGYNVQGNLWHEPQPEGMNLKYDAKVTTDEMNKVFDYVNDPTNVVTVNQIPYTDYWVSQIWNGKNDANASGVKAPTSESYPDQNGAKTSIVGGGNMDKLMIKESANGDWIHCNNFNAADNNDWKEGGEGGRTLMINSGTYSFGYTDSDGSHFSEKYIIVPGANIHSSLAGFYYVCFDFEKAYTAEEQAAETSYGTCEVWKSQATADNPDAGYWQGGENWNLPGFYKDANSTELKDLLEKEKNTKVRNITFKGYREGNHHFAGDGNYTDWIVRISPAEVIESSDYDVRIMAEDLNATAADGDIENSDWDFNDVVFDVKFDASGDGATIRLVAAGGVLPLYVAGQEVHALFGESIKANGEYPMINTGAGPQKPYVTFRIESGADKANNGRNIPITVEKKLKNGNTQTFALGAKQGQPAAKFAVKPSVQHLGERVHIDFGSNGAFSRGVQNGNWIWW